jgi:hypothetical protein
MINVKPTGKDFGGFFELEITENPYIGFKYYYTETKFGEVANDDGTWPLIFEYFITEQPTEYNKDEFEKFIGDTLVAILEEQIANNEIVYKGGIDETKSE